MFLWFAGLAFAVVLVVFSSPALDFRLVMAGAVIPVVEVVLGGAGLLHTLLGPTIVLAVVMLATSGRRLQRRRWLGLPIGMFMHLVLDGSWATTDLFWWPVLGVGDVLGVEPLPEFDRPIGVIVVLELVGLVVMVALIRRLDLLDTGREKFMSSGQLLRDRLD